MPSFQYRQDFRWNMANVQKKIKMRRFNRLGYRINSFVSKFLFQNMRIIIIIFVYLQSNGTDWLQLVKKNDWNYHLKLVDILLNSQNKNKINSTTNAIESINLQLKRSSSQGKINFSAASEILLFTQLGLSTKMNFTLI